MTSVNYYPVSSINAVKVREFGVRRAATCSRCYPVKSTNVVKVLESRVSSELIDSPNVIKEL